MHEPAFYKKGVNIMKIGEKGIPDGALLLNENSFGVKIVRIDYKKRTAVKVINTFGDNLMTYRFNNLPFYQHQFLSWSNQDCCNGWPYDEDQILKNIAEGRKPAGDYTVRGAKSAESAVKHLMDKLRQFGLREDVSICLLSEGVMWDGSHTYDFGLCLRNRRLKDIYDLDEILEAYRKQGVDFLDREILETYMSQPLENMLSGEFNDYNYFNAKSDEEDVITGLLLGYPLESTASILMGF